MIQIVHLPKKIILLISLFKEIIQKITLVTINKKKQIPHVSPKIEKNILYVNSTSLEEVEGVVVGVLQV